MSPLSVSYDATVFSWPGIATSFDLFGYRRSISQDDLGIALASSVDASQVQCSAIGAKWCGTIKNTSGPTAPNSCTITDAVRNNCRERVSPLSPTLTQTYPCRWKDSSSAGVLGKYWTCHDRYSPR